jgi:AcrR family transcriptional regulator
LRSTPHRASGDAPVPYGDAARALLRTTIVHAVDDLVRSRGWSATTMADVAAAAGVSRQTVYNEFGSRQRLVEEYVSAEVDALITEVEDLVRDKADDPHAALRGAFERFLRLASDEPVVRIIVADADGELIRLLTGIGRSIATTRVASLIAEVWPQVSRADADVLTESLVRLAISHALLPTGDPHQTSIEISRMIGPFVDEALA